MNGVDFGGIYDKYAADVLRFALYLTGNRADAEEIASETFVRAWVATGEIRMETVKAYLLSIARNLHVDRIRRRARQGEMPADVRDATPGPDAVVEGRRELDAVLAALQAMPEVDRAAVLMRADGVPYDEIARGLGVSPAAVRVKVHRARLRLAAQGLGGSS
jgi:RNA polymerase sigma-70 factor (ECF subfamily)